MIKKKPSMDEEEKEPEGALLDAEYPPKFAPVNYQHRLNLMTLLKVLPNKPEEESEIFSKLHTFFSGNDLYGISFTRDLFIKEEFENDAFKLAEQLKLGIN